MFIPKLFNDGGKKENASDKRFFSFWGMHLVIDA